jgi:flagellar hook-associated protein 1 FlgK
VSIFGTLTIGKQGLLTQARAIQVTSNNISNVNTPGYSRQRATLVPVAPTSQRGGVPLGGGVEIANVRRIVDLALDAQLQRERQGLAFDSAMETGLARLEAIFGEMEDTGITAALSQFFASLNDLASNPNETAMRNQVIQSATLLADLIRNADQRLFQLQVDANQRIAQLTTEVNEITADIAELNRQIFQQEVGEAAEASSLRDRRAQLLSELGEKIDFTSFEREDGQIAIFVGGGFLLLDSEAAGSLQVSTDQSQQPLSDPTFFNIFQNFQGSVAGPITSRITGGELGAALALRDSVVPGYRDALDEFAFTLANRVNSQHLAGYGLDDDTQRRLFVDPTQPADPQGPDFASVAGAASVIDVNSDIISDNRHLAAGATSLGAAQGAAAGDNVNALALAGLQTSVSAFFRVGDPVGGPATGSQQTLGGFMDSLTGTLGAELQATQRALAQEELMVADLEERRGAISGVSIDEEVTNLIRFERAYQAAARVIQVADDLLQQLLSI